jgi:hypothetical protein
MEPFRKHTAEEDETMSATSFEVTGLIGGHGERTIRWTETDGFDDPTGLVRYLILAGTEVRLPPSGPTFVAAERPDLVALLTARAIFDEVVDERIEGEISGVEIPPGAVA